MKEIWKPVAGFEGVYEVSDKGNVRSLDRIVTNCLGVSRRIEGTTLLASYRGYYRNPYVNIGKANPVTISRLVWEAFRGPLPEGIAVLHKNGNNMDDRLNNLITMPCAKTGTPAERLRAGARI